MCTPAYPHSTIRERELAENPLVSRSEGKLGRSQGSSSLVFFPKLGKFWRHSGSNVSIPWDNKMNRISMIALYIWGLLSCQNPREQGREKIHQFRLGVESEASWCIAIALGKHQPHLLGYKGSTQVHLGTNASHENIPCHPQWIGGTCQQATLRHPAGDWEMETYSSVCQYRV